MEGIKELSTLESKEIASLELQTDRAADTAARRVPLTPCKALHCKLVEERHALASQLLWPTLALPVICTLPSPAPCKVTLTDPVLAMFAGSVTLNAPNTNDTDRDEDPKAFPALTDKRVDLAKPDPSRHLTNVSDNHSVLSQLVKPKRNPTE